jgi:hypothetical protein
MDTPASAPPKPRYANEWVLICLLLLTVALREPYLQHPGFTLDEIWTAEVTGGRGSMHLRLPVNVPLDTHQLRAFSAPAPWPGIWTHMDLTHPPLYWILLRWWMDGIGRGDISERTVSVIFSLIAVALLFDVTRLLNGRTVAIWACLFMIVATPQVDLARKARNYTMAFTMVLLIADALVRIEKRGVNRKRLVALMLASLASALTHYFCAGTIVGMVLYAVIRLRGKARLQAMGAFTVAGIIFAASWGALFLRQLPLFSVEDPFAGFVRDSATGHFVRVIHLFLIAPATMFIDRIHLGAWAECSGLLYVVPLVLLRRHGGLLLWYLWVIGTIGTVTSLDLTRSSLHLGFAKYVSISSPGIYALTAALLAIIRWKWIGQFLAAALVCVTAFFITDAYNNPAADPRDIAALIQPKISQADVLIFASAANVYWYRSIQYLMLSRYIQAFPCPVVFLDSPPTGQALRTILAARSAFVFSSANPPSQFLPDFIQTDSVLLPSWGRLTLMVRPKAGHGM